MVLRPECLLLLPPAGTPRQWKNQCKQTANQNTFPISGTYIIATAIMSGRETDDRGAG